MPCSFNLPECYSKINFGDCSCETAIKLKAEETRFEVETTFWSIVDRDDFASVPSDMWAALEMICRQARNRDMWKGQCERQAELLRQAFADPDKLTNSESFMNSVGEAITKTNP